MARSTTTSAAYRRARRGARNMYLRARSLFRPYLDERICFMHLEKCGGTSVRAAIERAQTHWKRWKRPEERVGDHASARAARRLGLPRHAFREQILEYHLARDDVPLVTSHFQLDRALVEAHRDKWRFVVMLREPVQRWLSYYFFNRYKENRDYKKIECSLEAFLDTRDGRFRGQDYVRLLTSDGDYDPDRGPALPPEDAIDAAKRTLDAFDLVAVLEDLPGFVERFEEQFGVRLEMGRKRTNPASKSERNRALSPEVRDRIRTLCQPNLAVYDYARQQLAGGAAPRA